MIRASPFAPFAPCDPRANVVDPFGLNPIDNKLSLVIGEYPPCIHIHPFCNPHEIRTY